MENHGTKRNVTGAKVPDSIQNEIDRQKDLGLKMFAIRQAVKLQPKDNPENQNPSAGQVVADAQKILEFLQGN